MTIFYQLLPSEWLKQIYVDTSGVTSHSALMCTIEMVGADHILWGSDCPAVSYAAKRFKERFKEDKKVLEMLNKITQSLKMNIKCGDLTTKLTD